MENAETIQKTVASVGVPDAPADLQKALPQGQGGMITVILAAIAVLGGSAGWKFWQARSKQKHEEAMKKMELEAELAKEKAKAEAEAALKAEKVAAAEAKKKPSKKKTKKKS
jgi:predicted negative regulator of RcsB-dependent stress response